MATEPTAQTPPSAQNNPINRRSDDRAQNAAAAVDEATRAVNEASRAAAEASRRAVERQADATVEIFSAFWDQSLEANRQVVRAWSSGAEAAWQTAFDLQNAMLSTGLAFMEAGLRTNQQLMLEPVRAGARAAEKLAESAKPGRGQGR